MDKLTWILLLITLFLFGFYIPIDIPHSNIFNFKTAVDNFIPLWTTFILIYISYFGFLLFTLGYFIHKQSYVVGKVTLLGIIVACLVAYSFYIFLQSKVTRPVIESQNIFDWLYSWVNNSVPPYNAFPSLHVAISTICVISFRKINSKLFKPMFVWGSLIIASTVLTKQHYFLDVLSGLVLGIISFRASEYFLSRKY